MIRIMKIGDKQFGEVLSRSQLTKADAEQTVKTILAEVRSSGDQALFDYTRRFDHAALTPETVRVSKKEIEAAYAEIDAALLEVLKESAENIAAYHKKQLRSSWLEEDKEGERLGQLFLPIASVGVYVPGGAAAYPSSVLMTVIPAKVAGVARIVMATPCDKGTGRIAAATIVAADIAGVNEIYKIGGAQALAALAFGTESVAKVDKIVGPGNIYVALAKREVFGFVGIDSIAGPSEVLVVADASARADYVAADLLSQAEHDPMAACICVCTDEALAHEIASQVEYQAANLSRAEIIRQSISRHGAIVLAEDISKAMELANMIAPEHLELCVKEPEEALKLVKNAGAVFMGHYSPEPLGDYFAGPSHVLPTSGTARFFSPLNVDDFVKKTSVISYTREALEQVHEKIELFARTEGLTAHENSVKIRFK